MADKENDCRPKGILIAFMLHKDWMVCAKEHMFGRKNWVQLLPMMSRRGWISRHTALSCWAWMTVLFTQPSSLQKSIVIPHAKQESSMEQNHKLREPNEVTSCQWCDLPCEEVWNKTARHTIKSLLFLDEGRVLARDGSIEKLWQWGHHHQVWTFSIIGFSMLCDWWGGWLLQSGFVATHSHTTVALTVLQKCVFVGDKLHEEWGAPWQHMFGCMDMLFCATLNAGLWLEVFHSTVFHGQQWPFKFAFAASKTESAQHTVSSSCDHWNRLRSQWTVGRSFSPQIFINLELAEWHWEGWKGSLWQMAAKTCQWCAWQHSAGSHWCKSCFCVVSFWSVKLRSGWSSMSVKLHSGWSSMSCAPPVLRLWWRVNAQWTDRTMHWDQQHTSGVGAMTQS